MKLKKESRTVTLPDGEQVQMEITHGSGNVFADLDLPNADELFQKCQVRAEIEKAGASLGLTLSDLPEIANREWDDISLGEYRTCLDRLERLSAPAQARPEEIAA